MLALLRDRGNIKVFLKCTPRNYFDCMFAKCKLEKRGIHSSLLGTIKNISQIATIVHSAYYAHYIEPPQNNQIGQGRIQG